MDRHRAAAFVAVAILSIAAPLPLRAAGSPESKLLPDPVFPIVQDPRGMESADFIGDGVPDLAAAGQNEAWSSILLGRGDGTFASSRIPGTYSNDLAVGDFNEDGHVDIAEPTGSDIALHAGRGDGSFEAPSFSGCNGCDDYWWLEAADLNEDGHLDLIGTTFEAGTPYTDFLLLGDGHGNFGEPVTLTEPGFVGSVGIGDLDEDGHLDLVDAVPSRQEVCLYFGNGDGTFEHDPLTDCLPGIAGGWVGGVGDLDDDQHLDLVVFEAIARNVVVMLGDGAGGFGPVARTPIWIKPYNDNLADVNGDGFLDVVGILNRFLVLLPGRGDGGFDPEQQIPLSAGGFGALVFGDYDLDGARDIGVASVGGSTVHVIHGRRDGSLSERRRRWIPLDGEARALTVGDLDGDPTADAAIVAWHEPWRVTPMLGDETGGLVASADVAVGEGPCTITAALLDSDTVTDLITGNCGSLDASVLLGAGEGSFAPESRLALGL